MTNSAAAAGYASPVGTDTASGRWPDSTPTSQSCFGGQSTGARNSDAGILRPALPTPSRADDDGDWTLGLLGFLAT